MPKFDVAYIREQGVDLIIIPLGHSFGIKPASEQQETVSELQLRANNAGLAGTVVPVWKGVGGRMYFIAPPSWFPFFKSISFTVIQRSINKELFLVRRYFSKVAPFCFITCNNSSEIGSGKSEQPTKPLVASLFSPRVLSIALHLQMKSVTALGVTQIGAVASLVLIFQYVETLEELEINDYSRRSFSTSS